MWVSSVEYTSFSQNPELYTYVHGDKLVYYS